MHLTFYAKKELHNRECMGPGEGTVRLYFENCAVVSLEGGGG